MSTNLNEPEEQNQSTLRKYLDRQGRLGQLISLEAFGWLQDSQKRQSENEEAENKWARKTLWGQDSDVSTDDMRQTILGDVTNPTPVVITQPHPQNTWLAPLLAALAAGGGGYYLATKDNPQPTNTTTVVESGDRVEVGLGKLEDYQ
jgi:hypothetical protein